MMSMTFAAVIWDADDLCSVNTTYAPESSFTMSPRSTTQPLVFFGIEVPTPNSWDDKYPSMNQNELIFLYSLFYRSSFLFLTFVSCHAGFSHLFAATAFASRILIACSQIHSETSE